MPGRRSQQFQSAPPVKGATLSGDLLFAQISVSIRAPREGGDCRYELKEIDISCFNPRPP